MFELNLALCTRGSHLTSCRILSSQPLYLWLPLGTLSQLLLQCSSACPSQRPLLPSCSKKNLEKRFFKTKHSLYIYVWTVPIFLSKDTRTLQIFLEKASAPLRPLSCISQASQAAAPGSPSLSSHPVLCPGDSRLEQGGEYTAKTQSSEPEALH